MRWALFVLLVLSMLARGAAAQVESVALGVVELEHVLESVRRHHPLLAAERADVRQLEGDQLSAHGEFDPLLTVKGSATLQGYYDPRRLDVTVEQPTSLLGLTVYGGYRLTRGKVAPYYGEYRTLDLGELRGGVKLPLLQDLTIDSRRAGLRTSEARASAARHGLDELVLELQRRAASAYFSWAAAGQKLHLLEEMVSLARLRDAQLQTKVGLGALPQIEQLDNRRSLLERERAVVVARRAFEKASFELSLYLRSSAGEPRLAQHAEVPLESATPALRGSRVTAERSALQRRPELKAYGDQVRAARVERELAENRVLPRLDGFAEVSRDYGEQDPSLAPTLRPRVLEVGATFSLPLYLRKARGKLQAAEAKLRASQEKARFVEDKVRVEVRDAWSQLEAARERAELAREAAELALQVASGERERFELGASTVLFVNLREQSAADAQSALLDALAELGTSTVHVLTAMGEAP